MVGSGDARLGRRLVLRVARLVPAAAEYGVRVPRVARGRRAHVRRVGERDDAAYRPPALRREGGQGRSRAVCPSELLTMAYDMTTLNQDSQNLSARRAVDQAGWVAWYYPADSSPGAGGHMGIPAVWDFLPASEGYSVVLPETAYSKDYKEGGDYWTANSMLAQVSVYGELAPAYPGLHRAADGLQSALARAAPPTRHGRGRRAACSDDGDTRWASTRRSSCS